MNIPPHNRPNSSSSNPQRPTQSHRTVTNDITARTSKVSRPVLANLAAKASLQPIPIKDTNTRIAHHGSFDSSSLPRIFDKQTNIAQNDQSLEALKETIKELEKENYRLCHHVKQAEQSIKNYRGFLSNQSNPRLLMKESTTQTVQSTTLLSTETTTDESAKQLEAATRRVSELTQLNKVLVAEKTNHLSEMERLRNMLPQQEDQQQAIIVSLRGEVTLQQQTISDQRSEIESLKRSDSDARLRTADTNSAQQQLNCAHYRKLLSSVMELRQHLAADRALMLSESQMRSEEVASAARQIVAEIVRRFQDESRMFEQRINQLVSDKHGQDLRLNQLNRDLLAARNELSALAAIHQKHLEVVEARSVPSPQVKANKPVTSPQKGSGFIVSGNGDALKTPQNHRTVTRELSPPKAPAHPSPSSAAASSYLQQLNGASIELLNLQVVHAAEVKAVQHVAHVRELQRVSREREAALDKDRLTVEIKHLKEIQGILVFSINTAEQSLSESQPHVVAKLAEGRRKRLKLLEHTMAGRMRDVDQRSSETCAVSSAHLEGFQRKAQENARVAEEMTRAATRKLADMLQTTADSDTRVQQHR